MADRYAPALFLQVLAFWFVLRWLLSGRLVVFFGRLLVLMMVIGAIGMLDQHLYLWAACFAGAALLGWLLLRRRRRGTRSRFRAPAFLAWRSRSPTEVSSMCERRIGLLVDAAAPATVAGDAPTHCVLALAGDGLWVLEDQSRLRHPRVGRVLASWDRATLVSNVEHSRRGENFELSWPRHGALVRGVMPSGEAADLFAGHLVADKLAPH